MAAFDIPLSGLKANSSWLNTISNNLANLNTDGYKNESVNFSDIFNDMQGTTGNGDPIQYGSGVQVGSTTADFTNGNVSTTGVAANMALQGNGFFVVQSANGQTSYTRDGDFSVNSAGQLVTSAGQDVMGYPAVNSVISQGGALTPLTVEPPGTEAGNPTTTISATTNLNSSATVGDTFSTPITIYDSLGTKQSLTIQFTNTGTNTWSYNVSLPGSATGASSPTSVGSGTLNFDSSGNLTSPSGSVPLTISGLADGAASMNLNWNLTDSAGNPTISQLNAASATSTTTQDGFGAGTVSGFDIASDGTIQAQYSNNQTRTLGQVAVASFGNVQGLVQQNGGEYTPTAASGSPVLGVANAGGNGTIQGGAVESSNVDLSTQFSQMIVAQQGYEANAKALTAFDQVSQATIQLIS